MFGGRTPPMTAAGLTRIDRATLWVDLSAVRINYRLMRRRVPRATFGAVVKADAYGLGLAAVAATLVDEGCRQFWVNTADEADTVLDVAAGRGTTATVFTLQGLQGRAPAARPGVVPVLAALEEVDRAAAAAASADRRVAVAIQLDTGLGRIGLTETEMTTLAADPTRLAGLAVVVWMSQTVNYHRPTDPVNACQRARLEAWTRGLPAAPLSLLTSAGCEVLPPEAQLDAVRVGSALYGVRTTEEARVALAPVVRVAAPILRLSDHSAGATIGYGGVTRLARASRIATIGAGYGDGLAPSLGDGGRAVIAGCEVPLVGGLSMSLVMADVSALPAAAVRPGMVAHLIGGPLSINRVAEQIGWTPNALLLHLGKGARRCHTDRAAPPVIDDDRVANR